MFGSRALTAVGIVPSARSSQATAVTSTGNPATCHSSIPTAKRAALRPSPVSNRTASWANTQYVAGESFAVWAVAAVLLGAGTAMVYPALLAAVGDVAHPV